MLPLGKIGPMRRLTDLVDRLKALHIQKSLNKNQSLLIECNTDSTSPATSRPVTPVVHTQCTSMPMDIDSEETVIVQKTPDKSHQQTVTQSPILLNKGAIDIEQFIPQYSTAIQFLLDSEQCTSIETETEAIKIMAEELTQPKQEQNKALILKLQRSTFKQRRKFIQTVEDGNMQSIVEKYRIMKIPEFIVKEFEMMKPDLKKDVLLERWTDVLGILDKMFEGNDQDSDNEENLNTDQELIKIVDQIEAKIKFRTSKKEQNDLIAKVDVKNVDLSTKKKSPPRAIILTNQDGSINNTYMVGDGLQISTGTDIKQLLQLLVVTYYRNGGKIDQKDMKSEPTNSVIPFNSGLLKRFCFHHTSEV
ncbi:unnamed protein product [Mytilus edulis]|uniref:Uncharacterized protein n=1 Tax=Mytilus edulis TaxID=6550 RepID=A0A8S3S2L3_MYTED|nr:unnamed protein product [Mytilus edulis]